MLSCWFLITNLNVNQLYLIKNVSLHEAMGLTEMFIDLMAFRGSVHELTSGTQVMNCSYDHMLAIFASNNWNSSLLLTSLSPHRCLLPF